LNLRSRDRVLFTEGWGMAALWKPSTDDRSAKIKQGRSGPRS
jgi:hypothetical protein